MDNDVWYWPKLMLFLLTVTFCLDKGAYLLSDVMHVLGTIVNR